VVFGVLTTDTVDQALVRSEDNDANKGREAALTALQTSAVLSEVASARGEARVGFSGGRR
jgi:6,7-dimethyl-8-ribityllumazine synthase